MKAKNITICTVNQSMCLNSSVNWNCRKKKGYGSIMGIETVNYRRYIVVETILFFKMNSTFLTYLFSSKFHLLYMTTS